MTDAEHDDPTHTSSTPGAAEPGTDSTVTDWHGPEVPAGEREATLVEPPSDESAR